MTSTSVPPTRSGLIERFTAPGQPFELGERTVRGLPMRVYVTGPVTPSNGYGLTETTSAVIANTGTDYLARPDSVGRPMPGTDVRVVDPATGRDAGEGEVGELWFYGPNIVRGYWNNPEATAEAFTDGWFHTGDLGRVAGVKVPAYVVFRSQPLPRTASGKVLKRELRSAVAAEVGAR